MGSLPSRTLPSAQALSSLTAKSKTLPVFATGFARILLQSEFDSTCCFLQLSMECFGWVRTVPEKYVVAADDANRLGSFLGLATQVTAGETLEQAPSGERKLPNYLDSELLK